ncbi:MAG: type II secretion system protein [Candidatus Accumulibacter similis]|nr:MAG: type II secretion system protein [Candidatus Accumulibacter similis]
MPRARPCRRHRHRHQCGFTYLALLILVATLALATSATLTLGSIAQRREAEQRLLEVGTAYRQAIASYLNSSPGGRRSYPPALADLLKDPRYPGIRRHLRQLYPDPITGKPEWGLIAAPGGGIMGVHSLSDARAIKIAGFDPENQLFEGKERYSEWVFAVLPAAPARGSAPAGVAQGSNTVPPAPGLAAPAGAAALFPAPAPAPAPLQGQTPQSLPIVPR